MLNFRKSLKSGVAAVVAATMVFGAMAPATVLAQDHGRHGDHDRGDHDRGNHGRGDHGRGDWHGGPRGNAHPEWHGDRHWGGHGRDVVIRSRPDYYRPAFVPRARYYDHVRV